MRLCACQPELVLCSSPAPFLELQSCAGVRERRRDRYYFELSSFRGRRTHLFHHLAHGSDGSGIATFRPRFVALRGFLHVGEKLLVYELLPSLRNSGFHPLPDPKKLAAGLEEEIFVQQTVVQQGAGLVPVTEHHHREGAVFGSRWPQSHRVIEILDEVVLEKPFARLAEPGFAPQFVDL